MSSRYDGIESDDPKILKRLSLLRRAEGLGSTTGSGLIYLDDVGLEDWIQKRLSPKIPTLIKRIITPKPMTQNIPTLIKRKDINLFNILEEK
jgi:hypothetical protein